MQLMSGLLNTEWNVPGCDGTGFELQGVGKPRQADLYEFEAKQGYITRSYFMAFSALLKL